MVVGAENEQTGKVIAEQLIKYRNKKLEEKKAMISKLREKNANLARKYCKIKDEIDKKVSAVRVFRPTLATASSSSTSTSWRSKIKST